MSGGDESQYNDSNRAFVQAVFARGAFTFDEIKPVLAAIFTAYERRETLVGDVTEADLNSYISAANNAISAFDYEIRSTYHQLSRIRVYALINSTSDPITQIATTHTADEISFLKRVLDAMFETNNTSRSEIMAIKSIQAMNLHSAPKASEVAETQNGSTTQGSSGRGLTKEQAEKLLETLVGEGWFERSRKGYYSLSPRALMELRGWLMDTYNDPGDDEDDDDERVRRIKKCWQCKEIITTGQRCPQRDCPIRLHDICAPNYFRTQRTKACPLCKAEWTGNDFVGERAAKNTQQRGSRGAVGSNSRRDSDLVVSGAEEAED